MTEETQEELFDGLEDQHLDIGNYVLCLEMEEKDAHIRKNIWRSAKNIVVWEEKLYRRV